MPTIINGPNVKLTPLTCTFEWVPHVTNPPIHYEIDGDVYDFETMTQLDNIPRASDIGYRAYETHCNEELTFTAEITSFDTTAPIVEYLWDFGDGTIAYGPEVTHTYRIPVPMAQATLAVTDSKGRQASASRPLNLKGAERVVVGLPLSSGPIPLASILHLDELSGTVAEDSEGSNDGTYGGNVVLGADGLVNDGGNAPVFGV